MGSITPEGVEHFREDTYKAREATDCKRCEEYRDWAFAYSPVVRFLREKVAALNGDLNETNVVCRRCPGRITEGGVVRQSGGFSPGHGILLCANEFRETMIRGNWTLTQQFQNCVRTRAIMSVMARPTCKDDVQATKVVNEVWASCFGDTRPFEEVYR